MGTLENQKITSFTQLNAWKRGHELVLLIYKFTQVFPESEKFGLASQLRRAAISITSNIAEGFYRSFKKEKKQFYSISLSSVAEVQSQLLVARDVGYLAADKFNEATEDSIIVHKLINGLIKSVSNRPQ